MANALNKQSGHPKRDVLLFKLEETRMLHKGNTGLLPSQAFVNMVMYFWGQMKYEEFLEWLSEY